MASPSSVLAAIRESSGALPRGHHGAIRIVVLLLLVAAIVVVVVLWRQRRNARPVTHDAFPAPPPPSSSPASSTAPEPRNEALSHTAAPPMASAAPAVSSVVPVPTVGARRSGGDDGALTIVARDLTKRYGDKVAVDHLSFEVVPGRVTGFLGPNGAGKSTTMRLIMGLDAPNEGTVTIGGKRFHDLAWPLRQVGGLLEAKAVHPGRSAHAHLLMLAQTNGISSRRVAEVLELVGLTAVARQHAGGFSLGMGQRLGIAEALLGDPGVLLFDEPVNGLDLDGIRWVRGLLRRLAAEGRTVFVSSHLMSEMSLTADNVVVIGKGRLIAELPIQEFIARNSRGSVRVRARDLEGLRAALRTAGATVADVDGALDVQGVDAEQIGDLALRSAIALSELTPQTASLEEAFLESTEGDVEYRVDHLQPTAPAERSS